MDSFTTCNFSYDDHGRYQTTKDLNKLFDGTWIWADVDLQFLGISNVIAEPDDELDFS